jgi:MFS family permease
MLSVAQKKTVWGIYIGIALAHLGNFLYVPLLISTLGQRYSGFWAAFAIAMTYVGRLLASLVAGGLSENYGRKRVVVASVVFEGVALLGFAFASSFPGLELPYYSFLGLCVGIGSGVGFPGVKAALSSMPENERPRVFSGFQVAMQTGIVLGSLLGTFVTIHNFQLLFGGVFLLFMGYAGMVALLSENGPAALPKAERKPWLTVTRPSEWQVWPYFGLFVVSSFFWFLYIQLMIGLPLHISWLATNIPVNMPFWITASTMLIFQVTFYKRISRVLSETQIMVVGLAVLMLAFLMLGLGQTAAWVVAACVTIVFGEMCFIPAFDIWVTRKVSESATGNADRAMGTMHFFRSAGNLLGTATAGLSFDFARHHNAPGSNWVALAGVAVLCAGYVYYKDTAPRALPAAATAS